MRKDDVAKYFLAFGLLILLGAGLDGKNLLKNGDFEKFNGDEPEGWSTTNFPKTLTVVSPTSRAHGGKSAVKCEVKLFYGSPMVGMITQKKIPLAGPNIAVSGYYVLSSVGHDAGFITFDLQDQQGSNVRTCQQYLNKPVAEYTRFTVSGTAPSNASFLELRISLLPGEGSERLHEGSYLLIDDVELTAVSAEPGNVSP
jgi:hypothetical protein